ncbi:dethiobiotin synthase [Rheinheimera sp. 4Y26]|uniref:dethiobiotin synthase n=1 Tax=Rheinheimera sp. 4Y26 TaxID=2977811 RepID=UPI0021B0CDF2|nr:dethiobiotin synthase [Rheinheimera sp. 4Y26]MCT6700747.1 dethiobiotin synthase [Rheinheimera sp. 4Y26]
MQSVFITATDTDAGKTFISSALLKGFTRLNIPAIGLKPIAAGVDADGKNADAKTLQQLSALELSYSSVNPVLFDEPVAPHLAANLNQSCIDTKKLDTQLVETAQLPVRLRLIEGAGGWLLPLDDGRYLADWVLAQKLPVLLVVGMKLGCLNHAMLTARELERSGTRVLGWVANCVDPQMLLLDENIADLQQRLPWPCLGVMPYQSAATAEREAALAELQTALAKALANTMSLL